MNVEKQNHLTQEELDACLTRHISFEDKEKYLSHIEKCTYCSDRFANRITLDMEPPVYLEEEILRNVESMNLQWKKQLRKSSKKVQVFFYSLKVAFTVSVSILLLFICVGSYHEIGDYQKSDHIFQNQYEISWNHSIRLHDGSKPNQEKSIVDVLNKFAKNCFPQ